MFRAIFFLALALPMLAQTLITPDLVATWGKAATAINPASIQGMLLWLQADSLSNNANGTAIPLWPDISGNNNHFTNETSARQPWITNNVANGHSAVRFAGTSLDFRWLSNNTGFATGATQAEFFVVVKPTVSPAASSVDIPWSFKRAGNGNSSFPNTSANVQNEFGNNVPITYSANITNNYRLVTALTNGFQIWNATIRTNEMIGRWNGDVVIGLDLIESTSIGISNLTTIGRDAANSTTWNGEIAELMLYSNVLSSVDRESIYTFLSNRYSISYTNPAISITPSNFPGILAWWKASDIATNDGSPVTNWVDRVSGLQWTNMKSGTTLPIYKSTGLHGVPGLQFLGTASNQTMLLAATSLKLTNYAILIVEACTNTTRVLTGGGGAFTYQWLVRVSGQNWSFRNPASVQKTFPRGTNEVVLDTWMQNSAEVRLMQNATNASTGSVLGEMQVDTLMPATLTGDNMIGEIVIFNNPSTPITAEQVAKMYYRYFRDQYGLP